MIRKKDRAKLVKLCDTAWSRYVRKRDKETCQMCGKQSNHLQCAHFYGRANWSVRYDEDNCAALCHYCHMYRAHRDAGFTADWWRQRLGNEAMDALTARARGVEKADAGWLEMQYAIIKEKG